ncbi:DUF2528 family protein [Aliidiomarina sanyensis]|uniref:Uncharacterized protein n=1 Tax=Aliidiomarina sanyensis TaxID=1249555 RepID=A0A432WB65_9GAMM|nr:DUF2528 family protein [Aliidiomarina sanyensis]RUO28215.1 hypothetical protein CWE11_10930 [Aliidiomarina sanyensis]
MSIKLYEFETFSGIVTRLAIDTEWKDEHFSSLSEFCKELNEYFAYSESYLRDAKGCHIEAALRRIAELVPPMKLGEGLNNYGVSVEFYRYFGEEAYPNLDGSKGIYFISTSACPEDFEVELNEVKELSKDELKSNLPTGNF